MLGQARVDDKSTEIVAIPKLLDLLVTEGAMVTIDAIGCQRQIARKILDRGGDYVLALKGNQTSLHEDVALFFAEQTARYFAECAPELHEPQEKSHGRIETRVITALDDIAWLKERHDWPGLASIVMVESNRESSPRARRKIERETSGYIASIVADAERRGKVIRGH